MYTVKNMDDFQDQLSSNVSLQNDFKADPVKAAEKINFVSPVPDTWIYRIVVASLGLSILFVIIGVVILSIREGGNDSKIPTVLTAISSGAIGALAGLLAPSPVKQ
jgi:hypothetical protein